jgi:hypothetical protein
MITPVIINRLQWKAYLIFMCTNLAFIPLVYFCYPETANLTLEEIDYLFTNKEEGAVKLSKQLHKERKKYGHTRRLTADNMGGALGKGDEAAEKSPTDEHVEKVEGV